MKRLNYCVLTLMIIGAINWGLIGFLGIDMFRIVFMGQFQWIARFIFCLVGLAGLWAITLYPTISEDGQGAERK